MQRPAHPLTGQRMWLALILVGFVVLATVYSLATPLFEASDELWHYPMVQYVADHGFGLPVQDPANPGPWRQEGSQPPLYYQLGALLTFWIDTGDLDQARQINPHAQLGVIVPDGNANMVIPNGARDDPFPWSGAVLAARLVRFLSILMGAATVYLTYLLGRELFPDRPSVALAAAAFTAFNPMFLFISAVINNDNLSTLAASALLVLVVRLIKRHDAPPLREYVILGVVAGAGMLAKFQIGFMLPIIAAVLLMLSIRLRDWHPVVVGGLIAGGLTIVIAGWWYWRNYDLYGDATGINIFLDIVGRRDTPADLRQLWTERETFMMSFWGFFGGLNVPMPDGYYTALNIVALLGAAGLVYTLGRAVLSGRQARAEAPDRSLILARALAALWPVIVLLSLVLWTRQTWATQGRLWFSAIAALNLWLAVGLAAWSRRSSASTAANLGVGVAVFVAIAALQPFSTIRPTYELDRDADWPAELSFETDESRTACLREPEQDTAALCLTYQMLDGSLFPGDTLYFAPEFEVTGPLTRNWSLFVHLVDEGGGIQAQRDVLPGGGLVATSESTPGERWNNPIAVPIDETIYAPQTLSVYLGLYHMQPDGTAGPRMAVVDGDPGDPARLFLGQVELEPRAFERNFGDTLLLTGYEVAPRTLRAGEQTTFTLTWQALDDLDGDYVVSIQVLKPGTQHQIAQDDSVPDPPPSTWQPGQTVSVTRTLTIAADAAPDTYRVMVRVYPAGDPGNPLRLIYGVGGQSESFVWLNWLQVRAP